jgi:hypothetical protein
MVNDVRRFAARQEGASSQADPAYAGAKWRPLTRAIDNDTIGRFAYVCINVSDMLNVNAARAAVAGGSGTNQVSLGHLFDSGSERKEFDTDAAEDRFYFSLQDFYAARYDRNQTVASSPYGQYALSTGIPSAQRLAIFSDTAVQKHVFITDGFAKAEPRANPQACNIAVDPPFTQDKMLSLPLHTGSNGLMGEDFMKLEAPFWKALRNVTTDDSTLSKMWEPYWGAMIKDYLDADGVVSVLNAPCVEMAPMISAIAIANPDMIQAQVHSESDGATPPVVTYSIDLVKSSTSEFPLSVEITWPFKYSKEKFSRRNPIYRIKGILIFALQDAASATTTATLSSLSSDDYSCTWESKEEDITGDVRNMADMNGSDDANAYYATFDLKFNAIVDGQNTHKLMQVNSAGVATEPSPFANMRVVSTIWIQISDGAGNVVDRVPCRVDIRDDTETMVRDKWQSGTQKLYFKTEDIAATELPARAAPITSPTSASFLNYKDWVSLEVPDARFNHKVANWVAVPDRGTAVDAKVNQSTKDLLGKEGRDADIFLSISDAGYMQSPGELGFILRPFNEVTTEPVGVDFASQMSVDPATAPTDIKNDWYAMFRTFRLYDHGGSDANKRRKDFIYANFYCADADGRLPGARVNPLSDLRTDGKRPIILEAALWGTPVDYWFAATNHPWRLPGAGDQDKENLLKEGSLASRTFFNGTLPSNLSDSSQWGRFRQEWADRLEEVVMAEISGPLQKVDNSGVANGTLNYKFRVNRDWRSSLSDVYGDWSKMKWYSDETDTARKKIFNSFTLPEPLHEIDRKMLYAYSLDSFSDRQQLFLYVIRAEATAPSFGGGGESGSRSLSGGRAVALVWRDPYPHGYKKLNGASAPGSVDGDSAQSSHWDRKLGGADAWYRNLDNVVSPWLQSYYSGNSVEAGNDPRKSSGYRWSGWHDARVLFFKQLDK